MSDEKKTKKKTKNPRLVGDENEAKDLINLMKKDAFFTFKKNKMKKRKKN